MRIALCYKEGLLREALERLLSEEGNFEVVASATKASTVISAAKVHDARVVVLMLEGLDSEDVDRIKASRGDSRFHLLAIGDSPMQLDNFGIEVDKFVLRSTSKGRLFRAIVDLGSKEMRRPTVVLEKPPIYGMVTVLTPREHEIALKVAEGLSNRDIAIDLELAEQTVKNLVSVVMRKMGCKNRVQVALKLAKARQHDK
jgi:DNA-binding NarL/FixJ family response regulator